MTEMTDDEILARADEIRKERARERRLAKNRLRNKRRLATPEGREDHNKRQREHMRRKKAEMTPEELVAFRAKQATYDKKRSEMSADELRAARHKDRQKYVNKLKKQGKKPIPKPGHLTVHFYNPSVDEIENLGAGG